MDEHIEYCVSHTFESRFTELFEKNITEILDKRIQSTLDAVSAQALKTQTHPPFSSSNYKSPFSFLKDKYDYSSWRDLCPIMASASTCPYKYLAEQSLEGYYQFRTKLSKDKNRDLYTITISSIEKKIIGPIVMGDKDLSRGADGLKLWEILDSQLPHVKTNYLFTKMLLTELETMNKNPQESAYSFCWCK